MVETVEENVSGSCESAKCFRKTVFLSRSKIPRRSCKWPFAQERVFDCVDEHFFFLKKKEMARKVDLPVLWSGRGRGCRI